jgi:1,4-dihydroxy-2-naphthoate octaprenyltransferase
MKGNDIKNIIKLGRLHLTSVTLLFYTVGSLLAVVGGNPFNLGAFLLGLLISTTAILSMSYSNNYFDAEADRYNKPTQFSGGSTGLLENTRVYSLLKPIALAFMGASIALSLVFIMLYSYAIEILLLVVAGNLLSWFYSAPPLKFAYRGLGEIATIIVCGILLPGFGYFVLAKTFDLLFFAFCVPIALYLTIFILNAEIPDHLSDRKGKKNNIIIRKSPGFGLMIAGICGFATLFYSILLSFSNANFSPVDFRVIGLISLIPLSFVIVSLIPSATRRFSQIKLVTNNITSVLIGLVLNNVYLFYVVLTK